MTKFDDMLRLGRTGESVIAQWMKRRGYSVLPVYEKEQGDYKGPALYAVNTNLIAPDMLCFKPSGETRWIEAKTKSAFTWHRASKPPRWTTGIDLRHYQDYLEVQTVSPWPIWLLFLQLPGQAKDSPPGCPVGLFGSTIDYLSKNENHRWEKTKPHMVYWAHEKLWLIATLEEVLPGYTAQDQSPLTPVRFHGNIV
jgi:hypothetical protein